MIDTWGYFMAIEEWDWTLRQAMADGHFAADVAEEDNESIWPYEWPEDTGPWVAAQKDER